jgi:hypothetical protein
MGYSGAGVKLIYKKTSSKKSRDTVPLNETSKERWQQGKNMAILHYVLFLL